MKRWSAMFVVACVLTAIGVPHAAGQPTRLPRVGYLRLLEVPGFDDAFRKGLRELGYVEGQNIRVEYRYAGGSADRLAELAADLVNLRVDVIVAGGTQAVEAARRATTTIPIVFPVTFDPVAAGFVGSLARPGGNLTGLSPLNPTVTAKRVELLREVVPHIARVAVLRNPTNSGSAFVLRETEGAAKRLGIRVQALEARRPDELEGAFRAAVTEQAGALMLISDNLFFTQQRRIIDLASRHRLPVMFDTRDFVEAGGLMSYGTDLTELFRRSATYVDKILKGARPAELPVEQAMKFELLINLKMARLIGLTIPPSVLLRADRVVE